MHVRNWPSSVSPHGFVVTVLHTWPEGHAAVSQRVKQPLLIVGASSPAGVNHSLPAAAQPPDSPDASPSSDFTGADGPAAGA
jgi:hypothetical protein